MKVLSQARVPLTWGSVVALILAVIDEAPVVYDFAMGKVRRVGLAFVCVLDCGC